MINRRCIRIKAFQTIYSYSKSGNKSLSVAEKNLFKSLEKTHQLYYYILLLVVDLAKYAKTKEDNKKNKYLKTKDSIDNSKFINNEFIEQIRRDRPFQSYILNNTISWDTDTFLSYDTYLRNLYKELISSDKYQEYNKNNTNTYNEDKELVAYIISVLMANDNFYDLLEDYSIYWSDEIDYIQKIILILVNKSNPLKLFIPSMYRDEEDINFAKKLLIYPINKRQFYDDLISKHLKNWDIDRILLTDSILIKMAVVEFLEMRDIPLNVTLNEYIDISKYYNHSSNSPKFINGILNSVITELIKEHDFSKVKLGNIKLKKQK